jgi:hypothetical protein
LTYNWAKLVGRAVPCPPDAWIDNRRRARSDAPYRIICYVHNPNYFCGARLCAERQPQQRPYCCGWSATQPRSVEIRTLPKKFNYFCGWTRSIPNTKCLISYKKCSNVTLQCSVSNRKWPISNMKYSIANLQCSVATVQWTDVNTQCFVENLHCPIANTKCSIANLHCSVVTLQCPISNMECSI